MISLFCLRALLGAAEITVAVPGFEGADVPAARRDFFVEYFSERLSSAGGLAVTTPSQISTVLGVERQRQLLGCSESGASCMAELAGALGAEAIITGTLAKVGEEIGITLKVLDARTGGVLAAISGRASREEQLLDFLGSSALQLRAAMLKKLRGIESAATGPPRRSFGLAPRVAGAVGVVAFGASLGLFVNAKGIESRLRSQDPSIADAAAAHALAQDGSTQQIVSAVLLGVGIAALVTAVALYFFHSSPEQSVTVAALFEAAGLRSPVTR